MTIEVETPGDATNHTEGDDDDDDQEEEDKDEDDTHNEFELGGESSVPCFCLLDGFFNDPESGERSRVTIPITKLPATLGRSHDSDDPHFFGLGKKKALSRKQCRIVYRDAQGGKVQWDPVKQHLVYIDPAATADGNADDKNNEHAHATLTLLSKNQPLPPNGFFVVENLGKNRILVNQGRVEQGNAAVLQSGSSIRVSSYTLYFLRPLDAKPSQHIIVTQLPGPLSTTTNNNNNKRKATPDAPLSSTKRSKVSQQHFDSLPVETLLEQMNEAIDNSLWERRHQLIGASIALHAIKEAAKDRTIQTVALNGGVSRSEIMAWVEQSPKYSNWVSQMLLKMEPRSYQAAITKCLLKAGFSRTSSSGRYIKWYLPKDTTIVVPNVTLNKTENATTTNTTAPVNKSTTNSSKQNSKQKNHDQQQGKGRESHQNLHDNENGEEHDNEEDDEEEGDEEGYDNEDDEKSGADEDRDQEDDDQDNDEQDMQDNNSDHHHHHDTEEGNEEHDDNPLQKDDLHSHDEDADNDDKSSSSELDTTRPHSSTVQDHADKKDNDDDDDEEEEEDEQDNYV